MQRLAALAAFVVCYAQIGAAQWPSLPHLGSPSDSKESSQDGGSRLRLLANAAETHDQPNQMRRTQSVIKGLGTEEAEQTDHSTKTTEDTAADADADANISSNNFVTSDSNLVSTRSSSSSSTLLTESEPAPTGILEFSTDDAMSGFEEQEPDARYISINDLLEPFANESTGYVEVDELPGPSKVKKRDPPTLPPRSPTIMGWSPIEAQTPRGGSARTSIRQTDANETGRAVDVPPAGPIRRFAEKMECARLPYLYGRRTNRLWRQILPLGSHRIADDHVHSRFIQLQQCYASKHMLLADVMQRVTALPHRMSAFATAMMARFDVDVTSMPLHGACQGVHNNFIRVIKRRMAYYRGLALLGQKFMHSYRYNTNEDGISPEHATPISRVLADNEVQRCFCNDSHSSPKDIHTCLHTWELTYINAIYAMEATMDQIWMTRQHKGTSSIQVMLYDFLDYALKDFTTPECLRKLQMVEDEQVIKDALRNLNIQMEDLYLP